jgi:hypothetical protein
MVFSFMFKKKCVMDKSVSSYVFSRVQKKRTFNEQKKLLDTRLQHKEIELDTYERSKDILEIEYYKKQLEEWEKVQTKFQNHFT